MVRFEPALAQDARYSGVVRPEPKIAVVIPVRNGAAHLGRAIESVLAQSEPNFELIVVDDNSTDGTPGIIAGFSDSRLRHESLSGKSGGNAARNLGTHLARSEIVTYLDADDELLPDALTSRISIMAQRPDCAVALSSFKVVKGNRNADRINRGTIMSPDQTQVGLLNYTMHIAGSAITLRKSALAEVGGWNEKLGRLQDRDVLLRLAGNGCLFAITSLDWVKYDTLHSVSGSSESYMPALAAFVEANPEITSRYRHLMARRVAQRLFVNLCRGNVAQARREHAANLQEPALGFSLAELLAASLRRSRI